MKSVVENNFLFKKEEVAFLHCYGTIDHFFFVMNYKSDIKVIHLYKYYINK